MSTCSECSSIAIYIARSLCRKCYLRQYNLRSEVIAHAKEENHKYYLTHKEARAIKGKIWIANNKDKYKEYQRRWANSSRPRAIARRLANNTRSRLKSALRKNVQRGHSIELLGCSIQELREYLENRFQPSMSWANYGRHTGIRCWEIDHIRPLASFNLEKEDQLREASHFSNLQPMWREENLKKGRKYVP